MGKIYFYEYPGVDTHKGYIKIGYTSKESSIERIREQHTTTNVQYNFLGEEEAIKKDGTTFMDKDFHKYLIGKGYKRQLNMNDHYSEWFQIDLKVLRKELSTFKKEINDVIVPQKYILRQNQQDCINAYKKSKDKGYEIFGLFAQPRFGKTITSFEMMNYDFERTKKGVIFFISSRSDIKSPIMEDYSKFKPSCNFNLIMQEDRYVEYSKEYSNNTLICCTKQFLDNRPTIQDIEKEFGITLENNVAAVYYDEAHIAATTVSSEKILITLKPDSRVYITGTAFKLSRYKKMFNNENSYHYNAIHEAYDIKNGVMSREENPEIIYLPVQHNFTGKFSEYIVKEKKEEIKEWFEHTVKLNGDYVVGKDKINDIKNIIWIPPRNVKYCLLLAECLNEIKNDSTSPLYKKLNVFVASAKNLDEYGQSQSNKKVYDAFNKSSETFDGISVLITLSKGLQSISYPECNAVIFWNESESPESYTQACFRVKTPNKSRTKTKGYVIDYDPDRCLNNLKQQQIAHSLATYGRMPLKTDETPLKVLKLTDGYLVETQNVFAELYKIFLASMNIKDICKTLKPSLEFMKNISLPKNIKNIYSGKFKLNKNATPKEEEEVINDTKTIIDEITKESPSTQMSVEDKVYLTLIKANEFIGSNFYVEPYFNNKLQRWEHNGWYDFASKEWIENEVIFFNEKFTHGSAWIYVENSRLFNGGHRYRANTPVSLKGVMQEEGSWATENTQTELGYAFINKLINGIVFTLIDLKGKNVKAINDFNTFQKLIFGNNGRKSFEKFTNISYDIFISDIKKAFEEDGWEDVIEKCKMEILNTIDENGEWIPEKLWDLDDDSDEVKTIPYEVVEKMKRGQNYDVSICGGRYSIDDETKYCITNSEKEYLIITQLFPTLFVVCEDNFLEGLEILNKILKEQDMKFNRIIANPPYNVGKSKIYHKCIEEMLYMADKVTVICPDAFKNMKQSFNKIVYYSHLGVIWPGVGIDVSIFELDNNHNSPVCQSDSGDNNFQEEREIREQERNVKQQEREVITKRFFTKNWLFDYKIPIKDVDKIKFAIQPNKTYSTDTYYNYMTQGSENQEFLSVDSCVRSKSFLSGKLVETGSFIFGGTRREMTNLQNYLKTNFVNDFLDYYYKTGGYRSCQNIPIPDLNDNNIGDDEYLYKLYNLSDEEIKYIKNKYYDNFIELNLNIKNFSFEREAICEKREAICEKLVEKIGNRKLRDLFIKQNEIKEEWFNKVEFTNRAVGECITNFSIINHNIWAIENCPRNNEKLPLTKEANKYGGVIFVKDEEKDNLFSLFKNETFQKAYETLNSGQWRMCYGGNLPIPTDLTDVNLQNEEYINGLYQLSNEEF